MVASGVLIPQAYLRYMNNREFRPPFEKRLHKNIQLLDDLRGVISLAEFDHQIWVTYATTSAESSRNVLVHEKVQALRQRFPETEIRACIFLVDVTPEQKELLSIYRKALGEVLTEQDYLIAGNVQILQKYMKNEFRFSQVPYEKDDSWLYDRDLILVDSKQHLRGHLDFAKAQSLDQEAVKEGKPVSIERRIDERLVQSIQYFIDHPEEEDPALSGEQ